MSRPRRLPSAAAPRPSSDATQANPMTDEQRIARAVAVATSGIAVKLCAAAERRTGRPRLIPLSGVLAAYIFHASGEPHTMTTSGVCRSVKKLKPSQQGALGIPKRVQVRYKRMHSGWRAIKRAVEHGVLVDHDHDLDADSATGEVLPCPEGCPFEQVSLDQLTTMLIQASLPPEFERLSIPSDRGGWLFRLRRTCVRLRVVRGRVGVRTGWVPGHRRRSGGGVGCRSC